MLVTHVFQGIIFPHLEVQNCSWSAVCTDSFINLIPVQVYAGGRASWNPPEVMEVSSSFSLSPQFLSYLGGPPLTGHDADRAS